MAPFQCDFCWFYNLRYRLPTPGSKADELLLAYIRRANLDIMWSRSQGTVAANLSQLKKGFRMLDDLQLEPTHAPMGPWPVGDGVGFTLCLQILRASQGKGKHDDSYQQYDTIRKLRTAFANAYEVSAGAALRRSVFRGIKGEVMGLTDGVSNSVLFERFMRGLLERMGRDIRSNRALSYEVLHVMLNNMLKKVMDKKTSKAIRRWLVMCGSYFMIAFAASLRGNEGFMVECQGLHEHIEDGKHDSESDPHVVIPLLGRFKNEVGERWHLILLASVTHSGFQVRRWVEMLTMLLRSEGKLHGPAFCNEDGSMIKSSAMDQEFHKQLSMVQKKRPDLIKSDVSVETDYGIFRSLRRGSVSRAREMNVSEPDIDIQNRWRSVEAAGGNRPSARMRDYYLEIVLLKKKRLIYSRAL